jgi:hypothetical protein
MRIVLNSLEPLPRSGPPRELAGMQFKAFTGLNSLDDEAELQYSGHRKMIERRESGMNYYKSFQNRAVSVS